MRENCQTFVAFASPQGTSRFLGSISLVHSSTLLFKLYLIKNCQCYTKYLSNVSVKPVNIDILLSVFKYFINKSYAVE